MLTYIVCQLNMLSSNDLGARSGGEGELLTV